MPCNAQATLLPSTPFLQDGKGKQTHCCQTQANDCCQRLEDGCQQYQPKTRPSPVILLSLIGLHHWNDSRWGRRVKETALCQSCGRGWEPKLEYQGAPSWGGCWGFVANSTAKLLNWKAEKEGPRLVNGWPTREASTLGHTSRSDQQVVGLYQHRVYCD